MTYFRVKPFPCWPVTAEEALKAPIEDELFDYKEVHDYHIPYEILELVDVKESDTFMWCGQRVACPDKVTVIYENIPTATGAQLLKYRYRILIEPRDKQGKYDVSPIILEQDRDCVLDRRDWKRIREEALFYMEMLGGDPVMQVSVYRTDRGSYHGFYTVGYFVSRVSYYCFDYWCYHPFNSNRGRYCYVEKDSTVRRAYIYLRDNNLLPQKQSGQKSS